MEEQKWYYEKLNDKGRVEQAPVNDPDGKITGRHVFNLQAWLDENPEERIRLGYVKHITHPTKDIAYNHATQYLVNALKRIDEHTIEDDWKIMDMSEEQMRLREMGGTDDMWWYGDDDAVLVTR